MINEVLNQPTSSWNCADAPDVHSLVTDSWIELFNPQPQALNLYAVHARIALAGEDDWFYLPPGSVIASEGFLVLFPLKALAVSPPAIWNLKLLLGSVTVDRVHVPALPPDQSYARLTDGSGVWQVTATPTVNASNSALDPSPTASPEATSASTGTPGSGNGVGPTVTASSGTQPVWSALHVPVSDALSPSAGTTSLPHPDPPVAPDASKTYLLLSGGVLLLLIGAALWRWLRLHAP